MTTMTRSGFARRSRLAASNSSAKPFSQTRRPTTPTTTRPSSTPMAWRAVAAASAVPGVKRARSMPFPRRTSFRAGTRRDRNVSTSSTFWISSAWEQVETVRSIP